MAGAAGGRRLRVPAGAVRPTPLRVREALFSILGASCQGRTVLDACAGTGALGLEALSRGADRVCLVERSPKVAALLRENVERLGLAGAQVIRGDALRVIPRLATEGWAFDLVFLDPPYGRVLWRPVVAALVRHRSLAPGSLVVVEHPTGGEPRLDELRLTDRRSYGSVALSFYESE